MSGTPGSSKLDEAQQAAILEQLGIPFVRVQTNASIASRRERRRRGQRSAIARVAMTVPRG